MFQLTVSVDAPHADWLYSIEDIINSKLEKCSAVSAVHATARRVNFVFACENRDRLLMTAALKECFVEMYAVFTKFDFIKKNLALCLPQLRYEILIRTLVAFDRENEHNLLMNAFDVEDGMALDGIFNFKLGELRDRWTEICNLTNNNGAYLYDNDTYNELLRFLISAVNPKINKLTVFELDGKYRLTGMLKNKRLDVNACDGVELMYYLIDLAPLELVIEGGITNSELSDRLVGIFDAKQAFSENKTKK